MSPHVLIIIIIIIITILFDVSLTEENMQLNKLRTYVPMPSMVLVIPNISGLYIDDATMILS